MEAKLVNTSEIKTYTTGMFHTRQIENIDYIITSSGYKTSFSQFVSTLRNESKDRRFRNECLKITKSKSKSKKQLFIDENIYEFSTILSLGNI